MGSETITTWPRTVPPVWTPEEHIWVQPTTRRRPAEEDWQPEVELPIQAHFSPSTVNLKTQAAGAAAKSLQLCPTLCDPIDGSPPGSPILGILQARTLDGLPFPSPVHESESEVAQSCPTLCDPMDCSPPGSPVPGIFQARVLEWGAIAFSV